MKEVMKNTGIQQKAKYVRVLIVTGIVGTLLTMLGDFLLMAFNTAGSEGMLGSFFSAAKQTTYTRIGLAAFFGFVGIPISGAGFLALCGLTKEKYHGSKIYRLYRASTIVFSALGGGVHILCCFLLMGLKKNMETGVTGTDAVTAVIKEQSGVLLPSMLVFMVFYGIMVVTQILLIANHRTCLHGWMAWINPLTLKILLNLTRNFGNSVLTNGISCSNMSLGCLIILVTWLLAIRKNSIILKSVE